MLEERSTVSPRCGLCAACRSDCPHNQRAEPTITLSAGPLRRATPFPMQEFRALALQFHPDPTHGVMCRWTRRGHEHPLNAKPRVASRLARRVTEIIGWGSRRCRRSGCRPGDQSPPQMLSSPRKRGPIIVSGTWGPRLRGDDSARSPNQARVLRHVVGGRAEGAEPLTSPLRTRRSPN
jgi:hypothetical protein